jgi:type III secretion system YscQ/HrcQ family protein
MSSVVPYPVKRVSSREVAQANRIFGRDPGLQFQLGPHIYDLKVEPVFKDPVLAGDHVGVVRIGERIRFALKPEERLLAMLLAETIPLAEFDDLPPNVRGAALEASLESLLERVDHFSGARSVIERVENRASQQPFQAAVMLRLTRKADGLTSRAAVRTDEAGLEWLTGRLGRLPGKHRRRLDHLPVVGGIDIGSLALTPAEIETLAPLDILLTGIDGAPSENAIRFRFCDQLTLIGRMTAPDRFLITNLKTAKEEPASMPSTDTETPDAEQNPLSVSEVPVTLLFEIGQVRLTMGELGQLQPGYTFKLNETVERDRPVTIKANGVPVGRGEIVQIDDRLGIRIRSLRDDNSNPIDALRPR